MGTYNLDKIELVTELMECLDDIEGDFNTETLLESLEFMKYYGHCSDSLKATERTWNQKCKKLFALSEEKEDKTQTLNKQTIGTGGKEHSLGTTNKSGCEISESSEAKG